MTQEREHDEGPEGADAPHEPGEGGTDELVAPGERGPRDGDIGKYEDEE